MSAAEQGADAPARLTIQSTYDDVGLEVWVDPRHPSMVEATVTYRFPSQRGHLTLPLCIEGAEAEDLYRLLRWSVLAQVREARDDRAAELDELLPRVREIRAEEIPPPELDPLILEHTGRKKVVDVRAGDRQYWVYVYSVVVHSTECVKVAKKLKDKGQPRGGKTSFDLHRDCLNGRTAKWPEILPQVREGNLHVTFCRGCKPLGEYTLAVNARTSYTVATAPPEQMPWAFPGFYQNRTLNQWQREAVWRHMMAMTPERWHALADLIAWAALEVDPGAFAFPVGDNPDVLVS